MTTPLHVKSLFLTGIRSDIPGLALSDFKFCILGVFMQQFSGYAEGIQFLLLMPLRIIIGASND